MVRRGSKSWKLRGVGFNKLGKTECAISAGYWGFERRQPRVGCEVGNQRPTSTCLEVLPRPWEETSASGCPLYLVTGMCPQQEQSHPSVSPVKALLPYPEAICQAAELGYLQGGLHHAASCWLSPPAQGAGVPSPLSRLRLE